MFLFKILGNLEMEKRRSGLGGMVGGREPWECRSAMLNQEIKKVG